MFSLGIEVSKAKLQACLLEPAGGKGKTTVVDHTAAGTARLLHGAARPGAQPAQVHAVREATGSDHEPAALALFDAGVTVSLVNPAQAKETPRRVRQSIDDAIRFLEQELARLQQAIADHLNRHPRLKADSALLTRIPAVGPPVSNSLLTLRRSHTFQSAGQLAAYLGVVPVERQSGTSLLGHARLSKAGPARVRAVR